MRVLVTGGAGFIGKHLVSALLRAGHDVVIVDNLRRANVQAVAPQVHFIQGDIRDQPTIRRAMDGCERVYHLAAQSNVMGAASDIDYSFTTNVVGTFHVLSCASDSGVKRVIFTSSREVYGEVDRVPVEEDRPLAPKNAYGASKLAGETYGRVFEANHGLEVNILRLANVYGPGDRDRVIPIWLDRAARGEALELYGGQQVLDFVPIELVVRALVRAGDLSLRGQPVNVGSGMGTKLTDLALRIQRLPGADVESRVLPARSIEVTRFVADVGRMRSTLGLEPPTDPLAHLPALWDAMRVRD